MRISRIYIENFRNFETLDLRLGEHVVIVGENKIGKSNLIHGLRLVLDPSLPDNVRQLRMDDFWDGLRRPLGRTDRIVIAAELADFEGNEDQLAVLGDYLVQPEPMIARLTYVFQPRASVSGEILKEADYEFFIYGGDRPESRVGYEVRSAIPLDVLPALRDAEADLANWRRSPLRPLLDEVSATIAREKLDQIAEQVSTASKALAETDEIKALGVEISGQLAQMVGPTHTIETMFGFSPTDPERLVRALRLFIDGGRRGIGEASLGSANLLYLSLKALELERLVRQRERSHTFLAIEEPEAHLHPHIQRLVYREFLRKRGHQESRADDVVTGANKTVLLTTHSPHIASVSPLRTLVLLRRSEDRKSTEGVSAIEVEISPAEEKDLERYLDVNRGDLLFARGVLLVEGDAEEFVVPVLARLNGIDFDELGITVCAVAGTHFSPYAKLLGLKGLRVPFAVITDADPDGATPSPGQRRVIGLAAELVGEVTVKGKSLPESLAAANAAGMFVNDNTFEVDLFKSGQQIGICKTLIELATSKPMTLRAEVWLKSPASLDPAQLVKDILSIGKGRFAQRLATNLEVQAWPPYIKEAVEYVAARCR
jgi:putative ATP-dependent endonuclease of OLD family